MFHCHQQQPGMTQSENNSACCGTPSCAGENSNGDIKSDHDTAADLCLAVIHENGTDVVLFDRAGVPRTFQYQGNRHGTGATSTATQQHHSHEQQQPLLCFKNHGSAQYDHWLTPCLDEKGRHGAPEESCFCGVETPHLHAHVKDPKTCCQQESKEQDIEKLASHVLFPTNDDFETEEIGGLHMPVTKQMPDKCNFSQTLEKLSQNQQQPQPHPAQRRLHKVQHGDHIDYLVHNAATGNLHLEHVSCNDCGNNDIHGRFDAVGQRLLPNKNVHIHFFEVAAKPFNLLDCLADLFLIESDARVSAVEYIMGPPETTSVSSHHHGHEHQHHPGSTDDANKALLPDSQYPKASSSSNVRSTFACTGICCATEIPLIEAVLKPLPGVHEILINVPLKQVHVDHSLHQISAARIAQKLQSFGSTVVMRDGGWSLKPPATDTSTTTKGRSQFFVQHICCASEIPAVRSIVEPLAGVTAVSINITTKLVYVDHDTALTTAQTICDRLNDEHFVAQLRLDAAVTMAGRGMAWVQSEFVVMVAPSDNEVESILTTALQKWVDTEQVEQFQLDMATGRLVVKHNPFRLTATQLAQEFSQEQSEEGTPLERSIDITWDGADPAVWDYPYQLQHAGAANGGGDAKSVAMRGAKYPRPTVVISGILWVISLMSFIGGNWEHLKWVALVSIAFGIPPIALKAFRTLRRYQFDTNCLMFFASVGAVALQDFEEAAAVVFLFALSEWLEVRATSRARQALAAIVDLRPETACLVHPFTQELLTIPATAVPLGALVSVKTGDKIPCDGVVVEGSSTVDESSLTGESRPIRKGPKDKVSGGTVNSGLSPLMVQTTSTSEDSAVSRLIRLVEEAQANRSETEKIVDEFAKIYTPIVVLSALLMCSISWAFGPEAGRQWTQNGLILLVVACPCALIISTPVSYVAGLAATAQKGILIKGGATLEALGAVKHICFDKTGTLTNGEFALLHMQVLTDALSREDIFQYLALMEERASHPVAQAILAAANNEKVVLPKNMALQKHLIINGEGVVGVISGHEVHVGNERLFERLGLLSSISDMDRNMVDEWQNLGGTIGYMSVGAYGIVCAYCAADGIREESEVAVKRLRKLGISITMLTGDNVDAALAIGKQVGLLPGDIKSKLLPEEKLQFVESLSQGHTQTSIIRSIWKRKQLVVHCGDGVNDAPALAAADVGVAMGEGAALSMETADVTLLDSDLRKLEFSIRMGQKVTSKIIQNVVFSLAVKFLVLGFALAGMTDLWAAIASDVGAMLLVTINAMLLLPKKQPRKDVLGQSDIEESKPGTASHMGEKAKGKSSTAPCTSGCCSSGASKEMSEKKQMPAKATACAKGCCGTSNPGKTDKAAALHSHDHSHHQPKSAGKPDGSNKCVATKGCCSSSTIKHAKHGHGQSHSHAHNHQQPTCAKGPNVSNNDAAAAKGCCSSSCSTKKQHAENTHSPSHSHSHHHHSQN